MRKTAEERFLEKIIIDPISGCWIWTGAKHPKGYGIFYDGEKRVYAHRYSHENFKKKPIPSNKELHHECNNRSCVNPDHLTEVTHRENMIFAARRGSFNGEKNGNSKLEDEDINEIRCLNKSIGLKPELIANLKGVSKRTIYYKLKGENRNYRNVSPDYLEKIKQKYEGSANKFFTNDFIISTFISLF